MTLEERFKQNNEKLEKGESKGLSLKDRFNVEAFSASDYANDYLSQAADSDKLAKYASVMQNADFAEKSQYKGGSGFHLTNQAAHGAYENLNSGNNKDPRNLSWTPNEKAVFNYLYNTEDYKTATQLLLDLTKESNVRYNEIEKAEAQKRIDNYGNLAGESALSIPQSVIGGLGQTVFGTSMGLTSALQGEGFSKGWTEAAEMNRLSNAANAVREASTEKIAQDSGNKVAPFLYQTGMSVGDSLFSALISGGVGELGALLALGGSASQQKTMEVLNNGGTAQEAAMSGITSGVIEGLTEKVSLGHLTKILKGNAVKGGFKELAKALAKNMLEEAGEEATSELTNALTDAIILDWTNNVGTESDLKKFYDEQIANGYSESEATENTIWELTKNTLVSAAGGALGALMSGGVTTGIRTASDYKAGKTTNEYGRTQDIADLARKEGREDIAQMIEKNPSNLNVGYAQDALAEEAIETLRDKKASAEDKIKGLERIGELKEKSSPITGIADKNGKMLHPTAIKWEEGSPVFVTEEGTYKAADVKVTDSANRLIKLTEDIPEQARQTFIDNYNGENLGDYVNKFELAYELAKADWQDDLKKMVTDGLLTEEQVKNIYAAAQKDVTSERYQLENLKKDIEERKRQYPDKKIRAKIDTSAVDLTKLNANQRHNVTLAEALAKALGFNLTLFDSTKETGERAYVNGYYEASTNTITLDINATNTGTHNKGTINAIITTLSHEITHWSKTNAPGIYKAFRDAMLKTLADTNGEDITIGEYVKMNKVHYPGLSDAAVADELVARACENMLQNSEYAKEALGRMTAEEQKTLKDKIVDFFNKIREAIKEIMGRSDSNSLEYRMLKKDVDRLNELQKMWDDMIREASANAPWANADISEAVQDGVLLNGSEENNFMFSEKTYNEGGREFLQKWLDKQKDLTKNEKKAILDSMEQVYETVQKLKEGYQSYSNWAEAGAELRGEDGEISVVVNNGEYALNIDFATVCKKREVLNRVLNELVKSGDLNIYTLTGTDVNKINRIIKDNGFEIACALCFVDAKRYRVGEWARSFEETYNDIIYQLAGANGKTADEFNYTNRVLDNPTEALISDAENVNLSVLDQIIKENTGKKNKLNAKGTLAKAIKENKSLWHKINASEIISSVGLDEIRMKNKELYKLVNGWEGSAKPKLSHGKVPYQNDILQNGKFNPKSAFKVGGVRIQSFSDFVPTMIFDYVQMVSELQAKGLPAHAYTKELTFAKLFGLTGIKINLSAIAKGKPIKAEWYDSKGNIKGEYRDLYARVKAYVGLKTNEEGYPVDANGNVITTNLNMTAAELKRAVYETDDESIDLEEAIKLQNTPGYDKNVGIIFVGASNNAIRKMLDDPDIPMIIPYHKSGINPVVAHLRNIASYTDYTNIQNTMYADGKKIDRKDLKGKDKEYYDSLDWYTLLDKNKGDAKKAAAEYVRLCEKKGWKPKFDEFKNHPNYYKLLEDFRMYDSKGKASPQTAVKLTNGLDQNGKAVLNMPTNEEFIKALEGDEKTGGLKKYDKSVSDLENGKLDKILKEVRSELQKVQYSKKYDVSEISEETNREMIEHFGTTTDYNVAGYMLKDGRMLDFSGRHWGDTASKSRQVDHREIAEVLPSEDNGFDAMVNMISNGNIRLMPEVGGINLSIMPTDEQFEELRKYIRYHLTHGDKEVTVDFDEVGGDTVYSRHFDSKTNPEHILIEIANYFRNGARVSNLMEFHTQYSRKQQEFADFEDQDIVAYVDKVKNGEDVKEYYTFMKKLPERLVKDIKAKLNIDVSGFGNTIRANEVRHIKNGHGENGDTDQTMADSASYGKIPFVINNYDRLDVLDKTTTAFNNSDNTPAHMIKLSFKASDGFYYLVEVVPNNSRKSLIVLSAYRNKKDIFADAVDAKNSLKANVQDEHQYNMSSDSKVSLDAEKVNEENVNNEVFSEKDGMGNGYSGYSMSNNALMAYENGEKPISKWSKSEILEAIQNINPSIYEEASKLDAKSLRDMALVKTSWHHTSKMYNKTNFYSIDEDRIQRLTAADVPKYKSEKIPDKTYRGDITYLEWSGTQKHPKAEKKTLEDVNILEKGSFYYIYDDDGKLILKKKIGSNGTDVVNYDEVRRREAAKAEREKKYRENSAPEAYAYAQNLLSSAHQTSGSGNIYPYGRKPSSYDYDRGLENFFKEGEQIIQDTGDRYILKTWNGKEWVEQPSEVFSYKDNDGYLHLETDDVLSMDDFEDYLNRVIGRNKRIEAHLRRLNVKIKDNVILNNTKLHEFAKIIKDRYGLTGTYKSIEEELTKAYMKVTDIEGFNKAAESVAKKLIEESRHQDIDPAMVREVETLKKELKGYKIALNDAQKQELINTYGSNWSSHLLGKVRMASDGIKLDELWDTLVSEHPDYFSTITDADEGANLAALLDRLYSGDYNGVRWTKEMTKERTEWLINDIREASWRISDNLTMAEKYDEAMKELRERLKHAKEEVREDAQRKRLIQKIVEREDRLITMLRKNDKENHIPDVLKAPLKALLDLVDVQAYVTTEAMANNFNALANALQNVSADYADPEAMDNALKDLTLYFDSNGYFVQNVKDIAAEVQAKVGNALGTTKHNSSILDLSMDSLKKLNEALVAISHAAWNYDKVLAEDTTQRISTRSESTMTFLGQFDKRKAMSDLMKRAISFLAWDNTTPIYGYDRFGNGGKETFRGIMKGDDQLTLNSKVIIDFTKSVFTGQEAEDWSKEIHDLGIGDYKITTAQIMSLYCLNKRQAAKQHLYAARDLYGKRLEGAVKNVYGEVMDGKGIVIGETKGIEKSKAIQVTKADVERITSMLTDRQKEVADKLQEFMGTVCADWGNYVTMRRFGIMQFGEDNYFPMQVFLENRESHPKETVQQASIFKLLNMGFTKSLNERGNGALELNSIFDVFIRHSSEMAAYNAFALPILDAYKWLSYKEEGTDGVKSLKTASRLAYGNDGINFIMNHLEDLNGTSNTATSAEQIVKNVIRRYKTAATAANMRVVLMQPTSYLRAVNEIDSKYLRRAINLNPKALKATIDEMNEKSPLAMKKNGLGAFDVNVSRTVAEQALQTEDVKSAKGIFEKAMNISMIAASKADEITWATLYKAVQLETKEKYPELKGDAFDSYVNDRFRDICYRTQVFDSINARSNLMRKKDLFHQMLTAFGSEPTLSYSMLSNNVFLYAVEARNGQYQRAWNKYGKKIKHAFVAFMLSAIAVSAVAAVPDWLRDDEDDKNFIETYFKNFGMNILGEATGLLPYFRDIYSVFIEGYDPSRPDEEIFKTAKQAKDAMVKAIEDGQITYRTVYQAAKLFSQSTGLPIGNLVRDFKSLWNKTVGEVFGMKIK